MNYITCDSRLSLEVFSASAPVPISGDCRIVRPLDGVQVNGRRLIVADSRRNDMARMVHCEPGAGDGYVSR